MAGISGNRVAIGVAAGFLLLLATRWLMLALLLLLMVAVVPLLPLHPMCTPPHMTPLN